MVLLGLLALVIAVHDALLVYNHIAHHRPLGNTVPFALSVCLTVVIAVIVPTIRQMDRHPLPER
jgi:hypothetical protein